MSAASPRCVRTGTTRPSRPVLVSVLAGTCLASLACGPSANSPSVILVSIDCLNQRQLEDAWSEGRAPSLARLAEDALVFRRAYAHAPWTTPSHMSMLTGLYPSQHGRDIPYGPLIRFKGGEDRVPLFRTLPERLVDSGYESVAFVGSGMLSPEFGLAQGFGRYEQAGRENREHSDLPENLSRIRRWIDSRQQSPFFLFLHTYELHYPLAPARGPLSRAIGYLDQRVGELLSLLRERDVYDSSLIILTSDHGSHVIHNEEKCCVHGAGHYEENLRVPFVMKLPGPHLTGRSDVLVRHVDIVPTVLDVLRLSTEKYDGPGSSITVRLANGAAAGEAFSYSEADARCWSRRAVVEERYKYIYTPNDPWSRILHRSDLFFDDVCERHPACKRVPREELYDIEADPFEETDLLKQPLGDETAAALNRLRSRLTAQMNLPPRYRRGLTMGRHSPRPIDDSSREALRALGYVE